MNVKSYEDLELWQTSVDLAILCYETSRAFPKPETFGLASQLQRAAVSIPANVAEGQGRRYPREFVRDLLMARGSLAEVATHVRIAKRLEYLSCEQESHVLNQAKLVGRLLNGLIRALEAA